MRFLSVRLIVSLIFAVALVSLLSSYYQVRREKQNLQGDLERRAAVLAERLAGNVESQLEKGFEQRPLSVYDCGCKMPNREPTELPSVQALPRSDP